MYIRAGRLWVICELCYNHITPSKWGAFAGCSQRAVAAEAGESPRVRRFWGTAAGSQLEGTLSTSRERPLGAKGVPQRMLMRKRESKS